MRRPPQLLSSQHCRCPSSLLGPPPQGCLDDGRDRRPCHRCHFSFSFLLIPSLHTQRLTVGVGVCQGPLPNTGERFLFLTRLDVHHFLLLHVFIQVPGLGPLDLWSRDLFFGQVYSKATNSNGRILGHPFCLDHHLLRFFFEDHSGVGVQVSGHLKNSAATSVMTSTRLLQCLVWWCDLGVTQQNGITIRLSMFY